MKPYLVLLTIIFFSFGCKTRNTTPEKLDPIYNDLLSKIKNHEQMISTKEKELENAEKDLLHAQAQTGEEKMRRNVVFDIKNELVKLKQKLRYWRARAETRKAYAREEYNRAFEKDESWPDPEEYKLYKVNERLVNASRNWDDRLRESLATKSSTKDKKTSSAH